MRYFLLVLLVLPLACFGVRCTIEQGVDGYYIHCFDEDPDPENPDAQYMTKEDCEYIKNLTANNLSSAAGLMDIIIGINNSNAQSYQRINQANWAIRSEAQSIENDLPQVSSNIIAQVDNINNELVFLSQSGSDIYNQCVGIQAAIQMAIAEVQGYTCSDQSCSGSGSGSGSVECPCQEEFNTLIEHANSARSILADILPQVTSNSATIARIDVTLRNWDGVFASITNRLNSPDDRMWSELKSIYEDFYSDLRNTATNQLDLSSVFYSIQQLIRGDLGVPLSLSTEGLIGLYGSVFSMVNAAQNSQSLSDFNQSVIYFSNTVSRLFQDYSRILGPSSSFLIDDLRYSYLYRAFTNTSYTARDRFLTLFQTKGNRAGITNWFERMEFYQQAALGWFDDYSLSSFEQEQQQLTESSIEHSLEETTNSFSDVSSASTVLTNSLSALVGSVVSDASSVQIQASLPTLITLFPEVEVGALGSFGPIQFDTSQIDDLCLTARRITSLVWKVSIWLLYLVVGFGLARLSFLLVLYIINFVKDL